MEARRRALGRGLGALIPVATQPTEAESGSGAEPEVPIDSIVPNPFQPRESFGEEALQELSASIRENGLLQPLLVRRISGGYQLIAGERRFRAAQRAGLQRVPVVVRDADDREALELALIENLQRQDLNPLEEAHAYQRLSEEFGLTQEEIARRVSKSRPAVANSMRLLQLPEEIREQIADGRISAGHARSLLALESANQQHQLAGEIVRRKLSVRATEQLARRQAQPDSNLDKQAVETELSQALGTRVRVRSRKDGSGQIEIEFYSAAELEGLISRLGDGGGQRQAF